MTLKIVRIALALAATSTAITFAPIASAQSASVSEQFGQFRPQPDGSATQIDYSIWDEALKFFVLRMGQSIREGAPRVDPGMGTRRVYGHESRYRLEGNRIAFSFLEPEVIESLTQYREDLQQTADLVQIAKLPKNEQLAFWINLHNVAVIEQIARNYPLTQPYKIKPMGGDSLLDDAKFITVNGVSMSPSDIRKHIVYPNWADPKVIYGFFHGDIGSPSIQREAFNGSNIDVVLGVSGLEFVNSLRGAAKVGSTLQVNKVYEEARPFYFPQWPADLRAHLQTYGDEELRADLIATSRLEATIEERDIADLSRGETDPGLNFVVENAGTDAEGLRSFRVPANVQRMLAERARKMEKLRRRGLIGKVIVLPGQGGDANEEPVASEEATP